MECVMALWAERADTQRFRHSSPSMITGVSRPYFRSTQSRAYMQQKDVDSVINNAHLSTVSAGFSSLFLTACFPCLSCDAVKNQPNLTKLLIINLSSIISIWQSILDAIRSSESKALCV